MEVRLLPHEVPVSIPSGSSSSDWRDSRTAPTFQASTAMMQVSEPHYNYVDPSPSTFASPTDSSPSASPQYPERRRHSATFPLFLAQHTSATPITIEPLDANNPGWSASSSENIYSPPSRYTFVARTGHPVTSMDIMPPPAPNYTFPAQHDVGHFGGAAVGMHRRRLSMHVASQFQVQAPHLYDARYGMTIHEREREQYHETTDIDQGRQHFVQEREDWPRHGHPFYSHYEAAPLDSRPMQPQLLLATTMPTNTPIVIDESPLVHANRPVYHQYDAPSQAEPSTLTHTFPTTAFRSNPPSFSGSFSHGAPKPTQVYAYAPVPHSNMQSRYRTNMDTCLEANYHEGSPTLTARHTAPHPAQPPCLQDDEPMASPTQQHGQGETSHKFVGDVLMHGAVVSPSQGAVEPKCAEGSSDQRQHYTPIESYEVAEDLQEGAPTAHISDRSESRIGTNAALGTSSHLAVEAVDERDRDGEDNPQQIPTASENFFNIKQSPHSSVVDLSSTFDTHKSNRTSGINGSVAVASLQQFTAPEFKQGERFERGDHDNRGNGEGAEGSTNAVNGTGAIKTPEAEEVQKPSRTISKAASGVHSTRSDIDQSKSLSLQTSSIQESADMQVISPSSYSQSQDPQGYNIPSVYPFASPYSKPTFNQHLPAIPSILRPEWRRSTNSEYPTSYHQQGGDTRVAHFPRKHSFDDYDTPHGHSMPPLHRNSLPNLALAAEQRSSQEIASAHPSPSQTPGYYTPGERLVPAAFGNPSSSHGSGSSASSTPPTVLQDASANPAPVYRYEPSASSQIPHSSQAVTYDSPHDQKVRYEPAYPAVFNPTAASSPYGSRGQDGVYYGAYPPEFGRAAPPHPRYFGHHGRGSSSPAPPMIAGSKRGREEEWGAEDTEIGRELQRRRSSYSQSAAMMIGGLAYRSDSVSVSPSLPTAEMGVIRVAGYVPSLQEMGVRDVTGEPLNAGIDRYANGRRPGEDAIRSGSDTSYSFIALPGNTVRKRPRRKFEEITRNYVCIWPGCSKAYGTLNHLNAHVTMQKHGAKRVPSEFKELRKVWRKQKREQQHQLQHGHGHGLQNDEGSEFYPDEDRENGAEDDEGSVYNPAVELTQ